MMSVSGIHSLCSNSEPVRDLSRGITVATASCANGREEDAASDSSEMNIVIQRTLDVQYDANSLTDIRNVRSSA